MSMSDPFPMSLPGTTATGDAVSVTVTATAASGVAAAMPCAISVTTATSVAASVSAFGVGDVVSEGETVGANLHRLDHPRAQDRDAQSRHAQAFRECAGPAPRVDRQFCFVLHRRFSSGAIRSF
jgi:hypothetical protein